MVLRIVVDPDLCQGHGVCESEAPQLFEVDQDRKVRVLDDAPDEGRRAGLDLAVKYCPTRAISIASDDNDDTPRGDR
jgi:ferredoxin